MRRGATWAGLALTVAAAISLAATLWPRRFKFLEQSIPGSDKSGHFVIMGLLAAALVWSLAGTTWRGRRLSGLLCLAGTTVLVSLEEASQLIIPGRTFSWLDLAYSWAGVLVLGGLTVFLTRHRTAASELTSRSRP